MSKKHNKGFTLVELIVVLVILAILAALLVPALLGYIDRSKEGQCLVNKNALVKAAMSMYVEDYGKKKTITDDASFDEYMNTHIAALYDGATPAGGLLQYENVCNQGGIVTLHVSGYMTRPFSITATCSVHDEETGDNGDNSQAVTRTAEEIQRDVIMGYWSGGLSHNPDGYMSSSGLSMGKSMASSKADDIREILEIYGIDTTDNIVAVKNVSSYKVTNDGVATFPIAQALSDELGVNVDPSYAKIITVSADKKGTSVSKGDERLVTQYLVYKGKDANKKDTEYVYGYRTVKLTYTENGNLGKYKVTDLDGNAINDMDGLVGWN